MHKNTKLFLQFVLLGLFPTALFCFSACNGNEPPRESQSESAEALSSDTSDTIAESATESATESVSESVTEATTETETAAEEKEDKTAEYIYPSKNTKEKAGARSEEILYVKDYGAVGDGVSNDGPAICKAVNDAVKKHATLMFEKDKTYCIKTASNKASIFSGVFAIQNATSVTIDGNGSTLKVKPGLTFFALVGCNGVRLCNMKFDLTDSVYLVGTVESVKGNKVTYKTDIDPFLPAQDYSGATAFSIKYNKGKQDRPHMFISGMKKTADKTVEVTYKAHNYKKGDVVFLPNPGIGHLYGEAIYLGSNNGVLTFENIQICSATSFVFSIKGNNAEMFFENVDIMPAEDNEREIKMVAWRDGFHCKDNRKPIHWNECDIGIIFDDCFNISNTVGTVTSVTDETTITVTNAEFLARGQNVGFAGRCGDIIDFYNTTEHIGTAEILRTKTNADGTTTLYLEPIGEFTKKPATGYVVGNRMTCAPDSVITNSRFAGTFRFLRDLRVENCNFDMLAMWCLVEGGVEGPLPGQLDFVNCTFDGGSADIGANSPKVGKHVKDIGFWGCTFKGGFKYNAKGKATITKSGTWTEADLYTNSDREVKK